jgi:serine protease Do
MNKKLIAIIIVSGLIGGVFGSLASSNIAQANIFENIRDFLFGSKVVSPEKESKEKSSSTQALPELYKPTLEYEEAIIKAVEEASPSVVSIVISKDLPIIERCPYNPFGNLPPDFEDFFGDFGFGFTFPCEKGSKRQEVGGGTGFIISDDGLILTNKHVVLDSKAEYTVLTNDGKKHNAEVLARDPVQDIAILKIKASNLKPARLGNSDLIKLGQTVIAIGNALGEFRNTVSVGVVSGLARDITASGGSGFVERIEGVIQTDAAINQGNSGGPLLNLRGEVIGINTAIAQGAQTIGFAIPINQAKRAIESVKKTGSIKVPYLGVRYLTVTEEIAKKQKLPVDYGALVRGTEEGPGVIPDSPAAKAGLQAEDIILEVNGVKITKDKSLSSLIQRFSIGDKIKLKVRRGEKTIDIEVKLEERPAF